MTDAGSIVKPAGASLKLTVSHKASFSTTVVVAG